MFILIRGSPEISDSLSTALFAVESGDIVVDYRKFEAQKDLNGHYPWEICRHERNHSIKHMLAACCLPQASVVSIPTLSTFPHLHREVGELSQAVSTHGKDRERRERRNL